MESVLAGILFFVYFRFWLVPSSMRRHLLYILTLLTVTVSARAQETGQQDQQFTIDTPASLDFKKEEEPEAPKKKKAKKKVFYGIKTKKGFTRKGTGERIVYETFYYLKRPEKPQTFVRDIYWYDFNRREIRKTEKFDPAKGVLLHGPYEKRQGEIVLMKGIFYKGTKHGRWVSYDRDSVLTDKEKYYRGWPKESMVSYYDPVTRKKIKEITPIEFGEREGYYYLFHDNGTIAVQGEFHWDQRIGDWTEYYPNGKRKKILSYPNHKEAFDKEIKPYVKSEWNEAGKEIYRSNSLAQK
jgi:antitoxin component YwqK of YwqJK toxin-antitoxin module